MKVIRFFLRLIAYSLIIALLAFVVLFGLTSLDIIDNPYENKPEIINLSQSEIRLKRNNSFQLNAKVLPDNTRSRKVIFKSDKPDIVMVNELTGFIEAKKNGIATITAYLDKYKNITAECVVIVSDNNIEITGITLNTKKVDLIVGGTFQLNYKLTPKESTLHEIEYFTSNPSVAEIDNNGKIEAKGIGTCNIMVSEKITGISEEVEVTVHNRTQVVEPKKIELSPKNITINVGGSKKIKATITPSNADNTVTWESLDNRVAIVSRDGVVTGKSVGTTQIVGTTINGIDGYINVTVTKSSSSIKVEEVKLKEHNIELSIGESKNIEYDIIPSNATNQGVKLKSTDTNVITITGTKINAVGAGTATLTIETNDGSHKDSAIVTVKKIDTIVLDKDIELSKENVSIGVNGTQKIEARVLPENATYQSITWESSNKNVATVKDGLITGKSKGSTEIIVKSKNVTKKIRVVVNEVPVESISLNKTSATLNISDTISLVKTISPSNATDKTVTWESSNKNVATVSGNGVVTAISSGTATITVTTKNNKTATCKVTVKKETSSFDITKASLPSGYSIVSGTEYSSASLKYKIAKISGSDRRYALVWVDDAYRQLNCGNVENETSGGRATKYDLFKIVRDKNSNKGIVGTNGGFNGRINKYVHPNGPNGAQFDNIPIIAIRGKTYKNPAYSTWFFNNNTPQHINYSVFSISKDNKFITKGIKESYIDNYNSFTSSNFEMFNSSGYKAFEDWYKNNGIRNAWANVGFTEKGKNESAIDGSNYRTVLCQIDEHNYIMAAGWFKDSPSKELHTNFNCKYVVNLDGGGSSELLYVKDNKITKSYANGKEPNRNNVDIIYFIEK